MTGDELERKAVVHATWTDKCCNLHKAEGCCDEDCGPCCEACPTCPTLRAKHDAEVKALLARLDAASPEQHAEWERQADEAEREGTGGVDYVRYTAADGTERVNNMQLTDGRHLCCICFEKYFTLDELEPVEGEPGKVWDVCKGCAKRERQMARK